MKNNPIQTLEDLFHDRRFFELRDELEKYENDKLPKLLFFRGAVANKFNQTQASVELLKKYLKIVQPTDEKLCDCYEMLGDNYAKNYQYRRAGKMFRLAIERFGSGFDENKKQNAEYLYNLWSAAGDIPPQSISFAAETHLQGRWDKIGLFNIPVEINQEKINFVFDTGADVSSISVSTAENLGLRIIECDISVAGASCHSDAKLAMASEVKIGNVIIKNVVLLVLEDKDLYFEKKDYQINGIIGYLLMAAFRQITITQEGEVLIPANTIHRKAEQNLCMDELKPLIKLMIDNQPMTFTLDSGAVKTKFWTKFLESRESEIKKTGKPQSASMSGVGGSKDYSAYMVDELLLRILDKTLKFKEAVIFTVPTVYQSEYHHGNIGQDWIRQFEKVTLDFRGMSIIFE